MNPSPPLSASTREYVLIIREDGSIRGLWPDGHRFGRTEDLFDPTELGRCSVEKASSVIWNEQTQLFDVILPYGTCIGSYPGRAQGVSAEISYLQERL